MEERYRVKHKARGRYGVLTPSNQWLVNFMGDKEQAQAKADELNKTHSDNFYVMVKT